MCAASQLEPPLPMQNRRPPPRYTVASALAAAVSALPCSSKKRAMVSWLSAALPATDCSNVSSRRAGSCALPYRNGQSISRDIAELLQNLQRLGRGALVDARHGEAHVHQHPVADPGLDAGDVDPALHAADVDRGELARRIVDAHDLPGNAEAHQRAPDMSCAAPIAAWPRARPPSCAGTCAWRSTVKPSACRRRSVSSASTRF